MAENDARDCNRLVKDFCARRKNSIFIYKQWEVQKRFQAGNGMLSLKAGSRGIGRMDLHVLRRVGGVDPRGSPAVVANSAAADSVRLAPASFGRSPSRATPACSVFLQSGKRLPFHSTA